jgi:hypothetical protein
MAKHVTLIMLYILNGLFRLSIWTTLFIVLGKISKEVLTEQKTMQFMLRKDRCTG